MAIDGESGVVPAGCDAVELLMLPGMDGTGRLFAPFRAVLPGAIRTRTVSYPTARALGYAELLEQVVAQAPERPYVLLAESFSGPLALLHASARPRLLRGLVLVSSFARNPAPAGSAALASPLGTLPFRFRPPRWAVRVLLAGSDAPAALVAEVVEVIRSVAPGVMRQRLREVLRSDVRDCLPAIDVPVLYLLGTGDRLIGRRGLRTLGDRLARLRTVALDGPHLLLQRRPAAAAAVVVDFLRGGRASGGLPCDTG